MDTNNYSAYPSCATSSTDESSMRFIGPIGPVPPSRPAPTFPISLLPESKTDFILRLSKWEIDQIVAPIKRGVLLGDSVFLIRDLSSNVELTIVASKFLQILEENDLYVPPAPSTSNSDSTLLSSAESSSSTDASTVCILPAPIVPARKSKCDFINGLLEHEVRELLAPVKSEVLSQDSIFSLKHTLTGMQFAVAAVELMDLFPDERGSDYEYGYENMSVDENPQTVVEESPLRKRKYLICILSAVVLVCLLGLTIGLVFLLGDSHKASSSAPGNVTSASSEITASGNPVSSQTTNTTEKTTGTTSTTEVKRRTTSRKATTQTPKPGATSTEAAVKPSTTTRRATTSTSTAGTTTTTETCKKDSPPTTCNACQLVQDVVLLIDNSNSIKPNFDTVKNFFVNTFIIQFYINAGCEADCGARFALATYTIEFKAIRQLKEAKDEQDYINSVIDLYTIPANAIFIGRALTGVKDQMLLPANGERPAVPNVVILLADQASGSGDPDDAAAVATELKNSGVTIVTLSLGPNAPDLTAIASNNAAFTQKDYSQLDTLNKEILDVLCNVSSKKRW